MKFFFSCDWGTSTFRLRLVDEETLTVLSEIKTGHGIATEFENWKHSNQPENKRSAFYKTYLLEQVKKLTDNFDGILHNIPVILSGMASSSIGMMELPYKEIPFQCDGSDLVLHIVPDGEGHAYKIILISGARSAVDVIRGEETMLAGCNVIKNDLEQLFIFPGTHSKHIIVKNGQVRNIITYMTGELFDLLSNKSILSASVQKNGSGQTDNYRFFLDGVRKGTESNLSNSIFHVRTNDLFKTATSRENYDYLSGLLIGHELKDVPEIKPDAITLVCSGELKKAYMHALSVLGLSAHMSYKDADESLIRGQWRIVQQQNYFN